MTPEEQWRRDFTWFAVAVALMWSAMLLYMRHKYNLQ